jgi:hypothetical protein
MQRPGVPRQSELSLPLHNRAISDDEWAITPGPCLRPESQAQPRGGPQVYTARRQRGHELLCRGEPAIGYSGEHRIRDRTVNRAERLPNEKLELIGAARTRRSRVEVHDDRVAAADSKQAVVKIRSALGNDRAEPGCREWRGVNSRGRRRGSYRCRGGVCRRVHGRCRGCRRTLQLNRRCCERCCRRHGVSGRDNSNWCGAPRGSGGMDGLGMSRYRVGARRADDDDDGEAERPGDEPQDRTLAAFARGDTIGVETVKAHRHPWAALVGTINSLASRHRHSGDDARHSGVTSASITPEPVWPLVMTVTKRSPDSSFSDGDVLAAPILTLGF